MHFRIDALVRPNGFDIQVNGKKFPVRYPSHVWRAFPSSLHPSFAQTMAFIGTLHLSFPENNTIAYAFPSPAGEAFFSYGLPFAMTENLLEYKNKKTTDYLRILLNSFYRRSFTGHAQKMPRTTEYTVNKKRTVVPFSFGKDSLLTLGLCREIGLDAIPIFFIEPENTLENNNKRKLIAQFKKKEGIDVLTVPVSLATLRESGRNDWGWDNFLTQYTLSLIPYFYKYKPAYLFWSNEYNRMVTAPDSEGFIAHHTFEQSPRWLEMLEVTLRSFGVNVQVASLLETLPELSVLGILHKRYPSLAAYQLSCLNDEPSSATKRWCGDCYECAKVYVYLRALGIDPNNVRFVDDILVARNRKHFYIFSLKDFHNAFTFNREEHLYVFWKSAQRRVKGKLIEEFVKRFGQMAKRKEAAWRKRYLHVYPPTNTPIELQKKLQKIFTKEVHALASSMR